MTPRSTAKSPYFGRGALQVVAIAFLTLTSVVLPRAALATLSSITTRPVSPTVCDSVGLLVAGVMNDPCHHVIGAEIEGPTELPTAGPIPTYEIRVRITVQEPNPLLDIPCPAVLEPYERGFRLGQLPFGRYFVRGIEYLVPFSTDSTVAPKDSSRLDSTFDVRPSPCPPPGCFFLSFAPGVLQRLDGCDATVRPGGTACFDVVLKNEIPVGGVQTEITVYEPVPASNGPVQVSGFRPISVEASRRAAGFQVAWTAEEGSRAKILLFTTSDATILAGEGPILHVCYAVAPEVPEGRYVMRFGNTIVADPAGGELMHCPTFAEITGTICVVKTAGCDLNNDGASDILDVIQLVHCALAYPGGSNACPDSVAAKADCNGDGVVNIRDVICCVRRILDGGFGSGGEPADSTGATRIGFTGPVQWISPVEGRASIEILPGSGFAGIQFGINAGSSPARIREIRLFETTEAHQLETTIDPGGGSARAMLFPAFTAIRAPDPVRLEVIVEPAIGSPGGGGLELINARSANHEAQAMPTRWTAPTAEVPQNPGANAPSLSVPAPNPFAVGTEIAYSLPTPRRVTLRVYSVSGRLIRTLVDASMPAGIHRAQWDGRDSAGREARSGIYFFKFVAGDVERTARVMMLR
jgi:hypothetical protein